MENKVLILPPADSMPAGVIIASAMTNVKGKCYFFFYKKLLYSIRFLHLHTNI